MHLAVSIGRLSSPCPCRFRTCNVARDPLIPALLKCRPERKLCTHNLSTLIHTPLHTHSHPHAMHRLRHGVFSSQTSSRGTFAPFVILCARAGPQVQVGGRYRMGPRQIGAVAGRYGAVLEQARNNCKPSACSRVFAGCRHFHVPYKPLHEWLPPLVWFSLAPCAGAV